MKTELIQEIGIDELDRVFVRPASKTFEQIYRAAMQIYWDRPKNRLHSPAAGEWTHLQWWMQIRDAAADEYGVQLVFAPHTIWSQVPAALRAEILVEALPLRSR
jgi:hypothetical protein